MPRHVQVGVAERARKHNAEPLRTASIAADQSSNAKTRRRIRATLAVTCLLLSLVLIASAVEDKIHKVDPTTSVNPLTFNDVLKSAMEIRIEQSRNLFEICLLFLGALWGLVIAKRDEA